MNFLFDILIDVIESIIGPKHDNDRSIVGESIMDRNAKTWAAAMMVILLLLGAGGYFWWEYR